MGATSDETEACVGDGPSDQRVAAITAQAFARGVYDTKADVDPLVQ